MARIEDVPLEKFVDWAKDSCPELGCVGDCTVIDYETGARYFFADHETAQFVASARTIVLELARRLQASEDRQDRGAK